MALQTAARSCKIVSQDGDTFTLTIDRHSMRGQRKLKINGKEYKQSQFRKLKNWLEFVLEG